MLPKDPVAPDPFFAEDEETPDAADAAITPQELAAAAKVCEKLFAWIWHYAPAKVEGLECRTIIACRLFVKPMQNYTLEQLAACLGKNHKQSIGRAADSFKRKFPEFANR